MAHLLFIRRFKGACANVNGNHCHFRDDKSSEKAQNSAIFALISGFSAVFPKKQLLIEKLDDNIRKCCPKTCFSRFIEIIKLGIRT